MDVWTDGRPLVFYKLILWAFGSGELKNKQTFASLSVWTLECIPETYQDDVLLLLSWFVRHLLIYIPQTVPNGLYTTTLCWFDGSRYPENNCILCNLFLFKCLTPHEWWFVQTTEEIKIYFIFQKMERQMSRDMTKPTKWVCAQWRLRSAWASAQSDQGLHCALNW